MSAVSIGALLIRADANLAMGTGHVMRGLALAQAWQEAGGDTIFAMSEGPPALERRLRDEGIKLQPIRESPGSLGDARSTVQMADISQARWIVVDGYHFGADYQFEIKGSGHGCLFVDDNGHAAHYYADWILNQNIHASESLYRRREPSTRLLLGTRYCMLRREFLQRRNGTRIVRDVGDRILIACGGSDPDNLTRRIIETMESVTQLRLELTAVVGASNPHLSDIEDAARRSRHSVRVVQSSTRMAELMVWADFAISAAGTICWEFCALGLPALLIAVATNQQAAAETLQSLGVAKLLFQGQLFCPEMFRPGEVEELASAVAALVTSPLERQRLARESSSLVDGKGASRVVAALLGKAWERTEA
jgi:UDP-2,4-diacetamido-2,4,6-trideoxy-beta-L-altropyranose hydrolase